MHEAALEVYAEPYVHACHVACRLLRPSCCNNLRELTPERTRWASPFLPPSPRQLPVPVYLGSPARLASSRTSCTNTRDLGDLPQPIPLSLIQPAKMYSGVGLPVGQPLSEAQSGSSPHARRHGPHEPQQPPTAGLSRAQLVSGHEHQGRKPRIGWQQPYVPPPQRQGLGWQRPPVRPPQRPASSSSEASAASQYQQAVGPASRPRSSRAKETSAARRMRKQASLLRREHDTCLDEHPKPASQPRATRRHIRTPSTGLPMQSQVLISSHAAKADLKYGLHILEATTGCSNSTRSARMMPYIKWHLQERDMHAVCTTLSVVPSWATPFSCKQNVAKLAMHIDQRCSACPITSTG